MNESSYACKDMNFSGIPTSSASFLGSLPHKRLGPALRPAPSSGKLFPTDPNAIRRELSVLAYKIDFDPGQSYEKFLSLSRHAGKVCKGRSTGLSCPESQNFNPTHNALSFLWPPFFFCKLKKCLYICITNYQN